MSDKEYDIKIKTSYDASGLKGAKKDVEDITKTAEELEKIKPEGIIDAKEISKAKDELDDVVKAVDDVTQEVAKTDKELNKAESSTKKVGKETAKVTKELDKAERSATEVAQEVDKVEKELKETNKEAQSLPSSLDQAAKSAENISVSTNNVHNATAKAAGGFKNIGYGALQASYFIDDMQYGMRGIMNNIPGLVMGFGGGMGLAGALGIGVVAANQIWNWLEKSKEPAKELTEKLDAFSEKRKNLLEQIDSEDLKLAGAISDQKTKEALASYNKAYQLANKERERGLSLLQMEINLLKQAEAAKLGLDTQDYDLSMLKLQNEKINGKISQDDYNLQSMLARQELDQKIRDHKLSTIRNDKTVALDKVQKSEERTKDATTMRDDLSQRLIELGMAQSSDGTFSAKEINNLLISLRDASKGIQEAAHTISLVTPKKDELMDTLRILDDRQGLGYVAGWGEETKLMKIFGKYTAQEMNEIFSSRESLEATPEYQKIAKELEGINSIIKEQQNKLNSSETTLKSYSSNLGVDYNRPSIKSDGTIDLSLIEKINKATESLYSKQAEAYEESSKAIEEETIARKALQSLIESEKQTVASQEKQRAIESQSIKNHNDEIRVRKEKEALERELKAEKERLKNLPQEARSQQSLIASGILGDVSFKNSKNRSELATIAEQQINNALQNDGRVDSYEEGLIKNALELQAKQLGEGTKHMKAMTSSIVKGFASINAKNEEFTRIANESARRVRDLEERLRRSGHAR